MARLTSLSFLVVVVGCGSDGTNPPPPNPPPPWGVPITGGTMLISKDNHAVIADPDRDRLLSVDLSTGNVVSEIALNEHDEPGRLVEDAAGRIHVALRRGGAIVTLASASATDIAYRRQACAEPRGLAYEAAHDAIHVACTTGELITFPAAGGVATRTLTLDRDLRDVVVSGTNLMVTRFRAAEVLTVDATGTITARTKPPVVHRFDFSGGDFGSPGSNGQVDAVPAVAWRTIALPDGRLVMAHQRQLAKMLSVSHGGYGGGCGGPGGGGGEGGTDEDGIAVIAPGQAIRAAAPIVTGALPVDIATNAAGSELAFVTAGSKQVNVVQAGALSRDDDDQCGGGDFSQRRTIDDQLGAPTSVGYTADNSLVVLYPEAPALVIHPTSSAPATITLPGEFGYDAGRALFHTQTGVGLACASCHPEGRDDGLVWNFQDFGPRRTQNLAGHILDRAPYHWTGDETDLDKLMSDVFSVRMAGGDVTRSQKLSLGPWLERLAPPAPAPVTDAAAVARGKALFESQALACNSCHGGELLSNKALVNVGTGAIFKVPSLLGVGSRAPYMHNGCALTLTDRFSASCGGGDAHGNTSTLTAAQIADLVSYLNTL